MASEADRTICVVGTNSPAVNRALARFWARRAELATDPQERERACREALTALDAAKEAGDGR